MSSLSYNLDELQALLSSHFSPTTDPNERVAIRDRIATRFPNRPETADFVLTVLEQIVAQGQTTIEAQYLVIFATSTLESIVCFKWGLLDADSSSTFRSRVEQIMLKVCSLSAPELPNKRMISNKLSLILVDIAIRDFSGSYPGFFVTISQLLKSKSTCQLGLTLTLCLSEETTAILGSHAAASNVSAGVRPSYASKFSSVTREAWRIQVCGHLPSLVNVLVSLLGGNPSLPHPGVSTPPPSPMSQKGGGPVEAVQSFNCDREVLMCLCSIFTWAPLPLIVNDNLLTALFSCASKTLRSSVFSGNDHALLCLNELVSKNFVPKHSENFVFDLVRQLLAVIQLVLGPVESLPSADQLLSDCVTPSFQLLEACQKSLTCSCQLAGRLTEFLKVFMAGGHFKRFMAGRAPSRADLQRLLTLMLIFLFSRLKTAAATNDMDSDEPVYLSVYAVWTTLYEFLIDNSENSVILAEFQRFSYVLCCFLVFSIKIRGENDCGSPITSLSDAFNDLESNGNDDNDDDSEVDGVFLKDSFISAVYTSEENTSCQLSSSDELVAHDMEQLTRGKISPRSHFVQSTLRLVYQICELYPDFAPCLINDCFLTEVGAGDGDLSSKYQSFMQNAMNEGTPLSLHNARMANLLICQTSPLSPDSMRCVDDLVCKALVFLVQNGFQSRPEWVPLIASFLHLADSFLRGFLTVEISRCNVISVETRGIIQHSFCDVATHLILTSESATLRTASAQLISTLLLNVRASFLMEFPSIQALFTGKPYNDAILNTALLNGIITGWSDSPSNDENYQKWSTKAKDFQNYFCVLTNNSVLEPLSLLSRITHSAELCDISECCRLFDNMELVGAFVTFQTWMSPVFAYAVKHSGLPISRQIIAQVLVSSDLTLLLSFVILPRYASALVNFNQFSHACKTFSNLNALVRFGHSLLLCIRSCVALLKSVPAADNPSHAEMLNTALDSVVQWSLVLTHPCTFEWCVNEEDKKCSVLFQVSLLAALEDLVVEDSQVHSWWKSSRLTAIISTISMQNSTRLHGNVPWTCPLLKAFTKLTCRIMVNHSRLLFASPTHDFPETSAALHDLASLLVTCIHPRIDASGDLFVYGVNSLVEIHTRTGLFSRVGLVSKDICDAIIECCLTYLVDKPFDGDTLTKLVFHVAKIDFLSFRGRQLPAYVDKLLNGDNRPCRQRDDIFERFDKICHREMSVSPSAIADFGAAIRCLVSDVLHLAKCVRDYSAVPEC